MKILLAEDERALSSAETAILRHLGYEVDPVFDGEAAIKNAAANVYDCILLDIMMPKKDGIEALKEIRASGNVTPVIMLTAKAEIEDRITGLDAGADDYLPKPFAMPELVARIRAATRRTAETFTPQKLTVGSVTLDIDEQALKCTNDVRLSGKETRLMEFFMLNRGKKLSTQDIFDHVWKNDADADPQIVWIYISYLREKLHAVRADITIEGEEGQSFRLQTAN